MTANSAVEFASAAFRVEPSQSAQPTGACGVASGYAGAVMMLASKSGREDLERGDEIAESLALDKDVFAQSLVRQLAISGQDRGDDAIMLGERI